MKIKEKFNKGKEKVKSFGIKSKVFIEDNSEELFYAGFTAVVGACLAVACINNKKETRRYFDKLLERDDISFNYTDKRKFKDCYVLGTKDKKE